MRHKIRLYYWNPNGTNDAEILDSKGNVVETIEELTFGMNLVEESEIVPLKRVLRKIAANPMDNGSTKVETLKKYFPSMRR